MANNSPWLAQLKRERPELALDKDVQTDVAIIGGGIAGATTAFFTLRDTDKHVALIEAGRVAHGATGHNAGQVVAAFERPFSELVQEFGLDLAGKGLQSIISAWGLAEEIFRDAKLTIPFHQFTGYIGCSSLEQVNRLLEDLFWGRRAGVEYERMYLAKEWPGIKKIAAKYHDLFSLLSQNEIHGLLETDNKNYIGVLAGRRGTLNSALFCEELIGYLLQRYPERFRVYEQTPVTEVILRRQEAILITKKYRVSCTRVVLCTNGFEHFTIKNEGSVDIDHKFHQLVKGTVGYMAGYYEDTVRAPAAFTYFPPTYGQKNNDQIDDRYFYLTRRPYEVGTRESRSLISIGGPEEDLDKHSDYHRDLAYPQRAQSEIEAFMRSHLPKDAAKKIHFAFTWHGLMGYTPNGVRCVGVEPCNNALLYNLGCNGIGILPSIFGSKRISELVQGKTLELSIFDPRDLRCILPSRRTTEATVT